jgi:hypothetical protein
MRQENFMGWADQVLFMGDCGGKKGTILKALQGTFCMALRV